MSLPGKNSMNRFVPIRMVCKTTLLLMFCLSLNGCMLFFYPKTQNLTFHTGNKETTVYEGNTELGKGEDFSVKIRKWGPKQIMTKLPGCKDSYSVMLKTHRTAGACVCTACDIPFIPLIFPMLVDASLFKGTSFDDVTTLSAGDKLVSRNAEDKFIKVSTITIDLESERDLCFLEFPYKPLTLMQDIDNAEKGHEYTEKIADQAREKMKKGNGKLEEAVDLERFKSSDVKFSETIYLTLHSTGFIDTANTIFKDDNNTLVLEAKVKKIFIYHLLGHHFVFGENSFYKSKLFLTWYIKNTFNEIIDSVSTNEYSGDFLMASNTPQTRNASWDRLFEDAIDISYLRLHKDGKLTKYIHQESDFAPADSMLFLNAVQSPITEKSESRRPSVIVKTKKGHGSGFAITEDGYIITNYHVIAGKYNNKPNLVKVITSDGEELDAKVARFNKYRDLALLKVEHKFDKAFKISNVKTYTPSMALYTIGAPKSVELGQSFSAGIFSCEHKENNKYLLQLDMSVNGGNSGGPVFDDMGNLHGVIVAKLIGRDIEKVSYAIPAYLIGDYLNIQYH